MLTAILVMTALLAPSQEEDPKEQAKELVNRGNQEFALEDFEGARADFEKAYEIYPSPKILMNIAEACRALGKFGEAVAYYESYLTESNRDTEMVAQVEARIAELEPKIGRIEITAEDAQITVDGEEVEGNRIPVDPGSHKVIVKREGHQDFERMVSVAAGQTETVVAELEALPSAEPTPALAEVRTEPDEKEDEAITGKWWFWTLIGVGVVAVAGASVGIALTTGGDDFVPTGELPRASLANWERF